jgi:hypothetical protein
VRKRIKRWTVRPRNARRFSLVQLLVFGLIIGGLAIGLLFSLQGSEPPDELIADAGPAEPLCAYLLRVDGQETRCDPALIEINDPQIHVELLMPPMPETCRPILSDDKGRLYPLAFNARGSGMSGRLGPMPEQSSPYVLRFIAWDERLDKASACGLWADYNVSILRSPPSQDAGALDSGH